MFNAKGKSNQIDVIIEGDEGYDSHLVAMVASRALREAGFTQTERVYIPKGEDDKKTLSRTDEFVPSVLDVVREIDPALFSQPIIIAAYVPDPYPGERRMFDRVLLRAETIARAITDDNVSSMFTNQYENDNSRDAPEEEMV